MNQNNPSHILAQQAIAENGLHVLTSILVCRDTFLWLTEISEELIERHMDFRIPHSQLFQSSSETSLSS